MPAKHKNTRKPVSKKKSDPALNLILKRLDTFDQRFDALDQRIDAVDRKVDTFKQETAAEFKAIRQETAAEFQAMRQETAQGFDSLRQEFKTDMVQSFAAFRLEVKADMQKEFEKHGAGIYQYFSRVENELKTEIVELRDNQRQLLTSFDAAAHNYEEYRRDRLLSDRMLYKLRDDVEELKKRDMEKAAAIDKIEKEIEKSKAA